MSRWEGESSAALFQMLQARVEHFFHAPKLRAPKIPHVVEPLVDAVEAAVDTIEARFQFSCLGVDMSDNKPNQRRVKQHWNADRDVKLFVAHQRKGVPPGLILSYGHCHWVGLKPRP